MRSFLSAHLFDFRILPHHLIPHSHATRCGNIKRSPTVFCRWEPDDLYDPGSLAALFRARRGQETSTPAKRGDNCDRVAGECGGEQRGRNACRLVGGESVELDGALDEPFWSRPVPADDFIQVDPINGSPATERTEVRIVFDREALYFGVTCFDSAPDQWPTQTTWSPCPRRVSRHSKV